MNRNQLILLFLALAVLGGASLLLLKRHDQSWSAPQGKMGQKLFPNFPINDVAALDIQGDSAVHLARKGDAWRVRERGDYPADFSKIKELLITLSGLKISQSEPIGPSQLAHMELQPPGKGAGSGTLVTFSDDKGKTIQSLLLGKKHVEQAAPASQFGGGEYPNGRYVMLPADPKVLLLITDPLSNIETNPAPWLNQQFFKIEKPASISVLSTDATNSWSLSRPGETGSWALAETNVGEMLDSNKVSSLAGTFTYANFVDVASNSAPAQTGLDKPFIIKISTFDHFSYEIKVGNKTPEDNYFLTVSVSADLPTARTPGKDEKPEDKTKLDKEFETQTKTLQDKLTQEKALGQWVYLVSSMQLEPLMRQRAQLMVEKKEEKPAEKPADSTPASAAPEPAVSTGTPAEPPK